MPQQDSGSSGPSRRAFLQAGALTVLAGMVVSDQVSGDPAEPDRRISRPVSTPDGSTLPYRVVDGVKVFHLIAEPVDHTFTRGLQARCWGYNGQVHGPTIEAVEGDRVRIYVTNKLEEPTTVHWHGLHLPSGMDGVSGLSQRPIMAGETFRYEFQLHQHGTFMYHSHYDEMVQMAMGLMGLFVIHPKQPEPVDRDYAFLLSEWAVEPGTRRPDPNEMSDFNVLTLNGKAFPGTTPIVAKTGERVRIRIGNLSAMSHHPIHLHGHSFQVVATDGGPLPKSARWPETTVLVPVGSTRTIEFKAAIPGDWAMHCHMTHHTMNQMGHGIPNLAGLDPTFMDEALAEVVPELLEGGRHTTGPRESESVIPTNTAAMIGKRGPKGMITMGGMFTILKIRDQIDEGKQPKWYRPSAAEQAGPATEQELKRDGIS